MTLYLSDILALLSPCPHLSVFQVSSPTCNSGKAELGFSEGFFDKEVLG